ncbi:MAG: PAS domain-containing protein [Pseudomonadota bacterium]
MSAHLPIQDLAAELERLRRHNATLEENQTNFQLLMQLMGNINPLDGLENMLRALLDSIVDILGGTNVRLWYRREKQICYLDFLGEARLLAEIDDPQARQAAEEREPVELHPGAEGAQLRDDTLRSTWTWAFPLLVGNELVGVIKLENLRIHGNALDNYLPLFFNHVALILHNEIRNETQRHAESELRIVKERLQLATEAGIVGVWDWDVVRDELVWDDAMYRLYGLPDGAFGGAYLAWANALHPDDRAYVEGEIQAALHGEREYGPEFRIVWPDGTVRHIKAASRTLRSPDGQPLRMVGINYDISESKRAEAQRLAHLRFMESLDRINRAIQGAADLEAMLGEVLGEVLELFECDRAGLVEPCDPLATEWRVREERARPGWSSGLHGQFFTATPGSQAYAALLRHSPSPLRFAPGGEHMVPAEATQVFHIQSMLAQAIYPRVVPSWEFGIHQCDRPRAWSEEEVSLFQEIGRRLADGITSMLVQQESRESERRLKEAEALAHLGYLDRDRQHNRINLSDEARRIFGLAEDEQFPTLEAWHRRWLELIHPDDREQVFEAVIHALEQGTSYDQEYRVVRPGGEIRYVHSQAQPLDGEGVPASRLLGTLQDITPRKLAEADRLAHVHFLESLDRLNRAVQGAQELGPMMSDALDVVLQTFDCDRAYLLYPCDPQAVSWRVPMERTRPEFPGAQALGKPLPVNAQMADFFARSLATDKPLKFGTGLARPVPPVIAEQFSIHSMLSMALRPVAGQAWQFGIQQCSRERLWTDQEARLLEEMGRRLGDALTVHLAQQELRDSEQRLKEAERVARVGYWVRDLVAGTIDLSEEAYRIFGLPPDKPFRDLETWNRHWLALIHPEDRERIANAVQVALDGGPRYEVEYRVVRPNGEIRHVFSQADIPLGEDGRPRRILGTMQDITERKRAEEGLRLAASVFDHSQEGIIITDAENRILNVNEAFTRLTGYSRDDVLGQNPRMLSSGRHGRPFYTEMWRTLETQSSWCGELWNRRKNGQIYPEQLQISVVRDDAGRVQNYVGVFVDISTVKEHEAELERVAHYDSLTSLPNRRLLADRLDQAIARALRSGQQLVLCYLDLDGFKPVNDTYGHEFGDRLLVEITARLKAESRADDTVARLGGDEFVLLFNEVGDHNAICALLDRILTRLSAPVLLDRHTVSVSASIGVTLCPQDDVDADRLLRHADQAMYVAKEAGKNRYQFYDAEQDRQAVALRENQLRIAQALRDDELVLYFQPKVNLLDGTVIGAEALVRWQHPERGLLAPAEFLHFLDGTDLAAELGEWVTETALSQIERWNADGLAITVSVNISPDHLQVPDFAARLGETLARHPGVAKHQLELEILESAAIHDLEHASRTLLACLALGVRFALDDFGTGYSSLAYFRRLPVETLKIDQVFVRDMLDDPEDLSIVESVIRLALAFNRPVIAEGVESLEHGAALVRMGCHLGQGYGIARPMPAGQLPSWIKNWYNDAAWQELRNSISQLADVTLIVAAASHRKWVENLAEYIRSERNELPQEIHSHQCRFGRWYRGSGANRYGNLEEFMALDVLHNRIHDLAAELAGLVESGDREQARARLPELFAARTAVLEGIERLTERVNGMLGER